jgi:hypothetical protein
MKIALLGDIHANLPALEATLCHAGQNGADAIWNAGDSIGYGAFPNEVISILRGEKAINDYNWAQFGVCNELTADFDV